MSELTKLSASEARNRFKWERRQLRKKRNWFQEVGIGQWWNWWNTLIRFILRLTMAMFSMKEEERSSLRWVFICGDKSTHSIQKRFKKSSTRSLRAHWQKNWQNKFWELMCRSWQHAWHRVHRFRILPCSWVLHYHFICFDEPLKTLCTFLFEFELRSRVNNQRLLQGPFLGTKPFWRMK